MVAASTLSSHRPRVRFSCFNEHHDIPNRDDIASELKLEELWYRDGELDAILNECIQTVVQMNQVNTEKTAATSEDDDEKKQGEKPFDDPLAPPRYDVPGCTRGLEDLTSEGQMRREQTTECVRRAVLEEQAQQRQRGTIDPDQLAEVSTLCSPHRQRLAHLKAIQDQSWALGQLTESEKEIRKSLLGGAPANEKSNNNNSARRHSAMSGSRRRRHQQIRKFSLQDEHHAAAPSKPVSWSAWD